MPSNATAGYNAQVFVSSDGGTTYNQIGELKDVSLDIKGGTIAVPSHSGGGWTNRIAGVKDWSATADYFYVASDVAQDAVFAALTGGTSLKFRFEPKIGSGLDKWEGSGFIDDWKQTHPTNDAIAASITIVADGPLTQGTQP